LYPNVINVSIESSCERDRNIAKRGFKTVKKNKNFWEELISLHLFEVLEPNLMELNLNKL
jgi:hypothetical protein